MIINNYTNSGSGRNVWILNHYAVGPADIGGTRHYSLARELTKKGYNVTIFASNWNHAQKKIHRLQDGGLWSNECINGVIFVWLRTFPYRSNNWRRALNIISYTILILAKELIWRKDRPDIIIGSSVHLLAVIAGRILAWRYRAVFIAEIRDLWPNTLIDSGLISESGIIARLMRKMEFFLYRNSDHVITLLPLASEYICQSGIAKEKVTWISNGVELIAGEAAPLPVHECVSQKRFKIFYTGSHGIYDALDLIIACAILLQQKNIKHISFVLVGDGVCKKQLIEQAKSNNLKNVEFLDPVAKHCIPNILQEADACILINKDIPLYKYGISSNKLFDYLAARKPVIIVGNIGENIVAKSHCGITVATEDTEMLANACMNMSQMTVSDLRNMGNNGRKHVEEFYSYEYLASRLDNIIKTIPHSR